MNTATSRPSTIAMQQDTLSVLVEHLRRKQRPPPMDLEQAWARSADPIAMATIVGKPVAEFDVSFYRSLTVDAVMGSLAGLGFASFDRFCERLPTFVTDLGLIVWLRRWAWATATDASVNSIFASARRSLDLAKRIRRAHPVPPTMDELLKRFGVT